jgi:enoyl-CoA hydratase/carnithine racemase
MYRSILVRLTARIEHVSLFDGSPPSAIGVPEDAEARSMAISKEVQEGVSEAVRDGIAEVVMERPPVNALAAAGWARLAEVVRRLGADRSVRALILAADGRGFSAGVDIKEIQRGGSEALLAVNRACYAAFAAVYECAVPVIAAVHGYCLGGGVGLVGNADVIVASHDASFGLPEVDRGALGAATHLARLVPQHKLRAMVYTGARATAEELHRYGAVLRVVERSELLAAAREVAQAIAQKSPSVIRAAKESLNAIDPVDVRRSYRFEQGFTYELQLSGVADEARDAFVEKRGPDPRWCGTAPPGRTVAGGSEPSQGSDSKFDK